MKVTFVLPPFDYRKSLGSRKKMARGFLPSLGIGYLASSLEAKGHITSLVDAQVCTFDIQETVDAILDEDPRVVCISVMNVYAEAGYMVAEGLKQADPNIFIIMGGPHTTSVHEKVFEECQFVDVVIPGEGEIVLTELVERVSKRQDWRDLHGIIFRDKSGEVVVAPRAALVEDLDMLPHPSRRLFDKFDYRPLPNQVRREPATTAITSRGCSWGKCTFCFQGGKYSPSYRRRSPENVMEEINYLVHERGIREVIFWDDTFAVNPKWIDRFCDLLERDKPGILWSCYGHMRAVRPDMLKRMSRNGCYNLYYGLESGVQDLLDLVKKGTTRQQIRDAVRWAKDADIQIRGSFILGFPTENPEQTSETIDFACELNADWMMFYPYHLAAGTPIEDLALMDGRIVESQETLHFPSFVSSGYESREQLSEMVRKAYMRYYLRPRFWGMAGYQMLRHPSMIKKYMEAVQYWLDLTREKKVWAG